MEFLSTALPAAAAVSAAVMLVTAANYPGVLRHEGVAAAKEMAKAGIVAFAVFAAAATAAVAFNAVAAEARRQALPTIEAYQAKVVAVRPDEGMAIVRLAPELSGEVVVDLDRAGEIPAIGSAMWVIPLAVGKSHHRFVGEWWAGKKERRVEKIQIPWI